MVSGSVVIGALLSLAWIVFACFDYFVVHRISRHNRRPLNFAFYHWKLLLLVSLFFWAVSSALLEVWWVSGQIQSAGPTVAHSVLVSGIFRPAAFTLIFLYFYYPLGSLVIRRHINLDSSSRDKDDDETIGTCQDQTGGPRNNSQPATARASPLSDAHPRTFQFTLPAIGIQRQSEIVSNPDQNEQEDAAPWQVTTRLWVETHPSAKKGLAFVVLWFFCLAVCAGIQADVPVFVPCDADTPGYASCIIYVDVNSTETLRVIPPKTVAACTFVQCALIPIVWFRLSLRHRQILINYRATQRFTVFSLILGALTTGSAFFRFLLLLDAYRSVGFAFTTIVVLADMTDIAICCVIAFRAAKFSFLPKSSE